MTNETKLLGDTSISDTATVGLGVVIDGRLGPVIIQDHVSIGHGVVLIGPCTIGENAKIGHNVVITSDIPPRATIRLDKSSWEVSFGSSRPSSNGRIREQDSSTVPEICSAHGPVSQLSATTHVDLRGRLRVIDSLNQSLPFKIQRMFWVDGVPNGEPRGEHAHRECWQGLHVIQGDLKVLLDDGLRYTTVNLTPEFGILLVPPLVWATQFDHSADCLLAVYCSHAYDSSDYIRSYGDFQLAVESKSEI